MEEPDIEKIEEQTVSVRCIKSDPVMSITTKINGKPRHYVRKKDDALKNTLKRMYINLTNRNQGKKQLKKTLKNPSTEDTGFFYPDDVKIEVQKHCSVEKTACNGETSNEDAWKESHVLMIGVDEFKIRVNAPAVTTMTLPKHLMVGYPVVPHLELEFGERDQTKFMWFRAGTAKSGEAERSSKDKNSASLIVGKCCEINMAWEFLTNTFKYAPTVSDIGCKLKLICIPRRGSIFGFSQEVVSDSVVGAGPGPCPFEERHLYTMKKSEGPRALRVVTYNILANIYADTEFARENMYPYCSRYAIAFDYRGQLILKEIIGYNSDLICLQECDLKVFSSFLYPAMKEEGYEGDFLRKDGEMPEGEALFYCKARFEEVKRLHTVISKALYLECNRQILAAVEKCPDVLESLKKRTAVGQMIALRDISSNRVLCILNTHLYFRPEATNIRLLQMAILLNQFQDFVLSVKTELKKSRESIDSIAPIICGDFNSTPKLAVIEYLTSGKIDKCHPVWKRAGEETAELQLHLEHKFDFFSACGYPKFTNYVVGFKDTLDYVITDKRHFEVDSCIPLPDEKVLQLHTALPSVTAPSDHLALVCNLLWKE